MRAKTHYSLTLVQSVQKRAQIFVLMPSQRDDDDIDCSDQHKPHRMCEGKAVQLINDEEAKDNDGRGVVPELLSQKPEACLVNYDWTNLRKKSRGFYSLDIIIP